MWPLYFISACLLATSFILYRWLTARPPTRLPPGPPGLPLIGNMLDFKKVHEQFEDYEEQLGKKYGDIYTLWAGSQPIILIRDPRIASELLDKRGATYSSRPPQNLFRQHINQWRLLAEPTGDVFRTIKRIYTSLLGPKQAASFEKHQDYESKVALMNTLTKPEMFLKETRRFSFSVVFSATYGVRLTTIDHPIMKELCGIWDEMIKYFNGGTLLVDYFPILEQLPLWAQPWLRKAQAIRNRELAIQKAMLDTLKEQIKGGEAPDCAGTIFLRLQEKEGINDEHACDILTHLLQGGADTTVHALQFFFKNVAMHPEAAKKAQAELDAVVGLNRLPTFEDKSSLPYLRSLIKELHRWSPIGIGGAHATTTDDTYRGFHIPAGAIVFGMTPVLNRSRDRWGDSANVFEPERYMDDERHAYNSAMQGDPMQRDHFHFGFGRRLCPGIWVAENNLWIYIARMLWAFDIVAMPGEVLREEDRIFTILARPKPFKVSITPRTPVHAETIKRELALFPSDLPTFDNVRV